MKTLLERLLALVVISGLAGCDRETIESGTVKVFRYDGSVECEQPGITLDEMMQELTDAGIEVICAQKSHDGLARTAVCGAGTGNINVYVIPVAARQTALDIGFRSVSVLGDYTDEPC